MLQAQRVVYLRLRPFAFFLPAPSFASNCCWVRKVSIDLARSSRSALHIHGTEVRQTDTKSVASRGIVALFAVHARLAAVSQHGVVGSASNLCFLSS